MDESTLIQTNKLSPADSVFVQASHYAQSGNSVLGKMIEASKSLERLTKDEKLMLLDLCKGADPLPSTLINKSVTIEPSNKLIGSAISELRKNGLLMTELDVRLKMLSEDKTVALLGKENMGQFKIRSNERAKNLKHVGFQLLSKLATGKHTFSRVVQERKILNDYYRARAKRTDITSLSYAGVIRIFKTEDVIAEFRQSSMNLSDEIITGLESNLLSDRYLHETKVTRDFQVEWLEQNDLLALIEAGIPPGIGPDDARIARKVLELEAYYEKLLVVLITDDKSCIEAVTQISQRDGTIIVRMPKLQYYDTCLHGVKRFGIPRLWNFNTAKANMPSAWIEQQITRYNPKHIIVLYDFPNIDRELETYSRNPRGLGKMAGGYLKRKTLQGKVSWAETEWSQFKKWKDFSTELVLLQKWQDRTGVNRRRF